MTWRMKIGEELGFNVRPVVGSYVKPDGWNHGECLVSGDDWDACQFRLPSQHGYELAVNVEVSGHTLQHPSNMYPGRDYVRVKITFVADKCVDWYTGEIVGEDTVVRGWMEVTRAEKEYI